MTRDRAAIANKRCLDDLVAVLFLKPRTNAIALVARTAECIAYNNLIAGIFLFAVKSVNTEVVRIIK